MAHNARREDYQRLGLRFIRELDQAEPLAAMRTFADFGRRFSQERDKLPQDDADRAFYLVTLACDVIDHELPFSMGDKAGELVVRGQNLLDEAIALDPNCFDAIRMRSSNNLPTPSERAAFLKSEEPRVREVCEKARDGARDLGDMERGNLAAELAMRPYQRWLASIAEYELIGGRNRAAIATCEKLFEVDPSDLSDARFTLALALAKLEDEAGLDELARRYRTLCPSRGANDAWLLIARLALAHRQQKPALARTHLAEILRCYPNGAVALLRQNELPDGEFARLNVQPYSEDELVIALSEAVVLLQEGSDSSGRGVLGAWVAENTAKLRPKAVEECRLLEEQLEAQYGTQGQPGQFGGAGGFGGFGGPAGFDN
ncbi:response regulator receiver protein [Paratractidigestivibacter sp.]|uniref:response regulator receiver protein n=1 Tax=Paratractidigestivibacter sp. TaxID=2847316 RepID=UPI002ABD47B1|nr:response regulator receiver protein [Paratractidigestivibacter sp.]